MKTWKYIWQLIVFSPWIYVYNLLLRTIWTCSLVIEGLLIQWFFDNVINQNQSILLTSWIVLLFTINRITKISVYFGTVTSKVVFSARTSVLLRSNLFIFLLKITNYDGRTLSSGELIRHLGEDAHEANDFLATASWTISMTISTIIALFFMIRIYPLLTLIVFVPLVIILVFINNARKRIEIYRKASIDATSNATNIIVNMFNSVQSVKINCAEKRIIDYLRNLNAIRLNMVLREQIFRAIIDVSSENMTNFALGLILFFVGQSMSSGRFTVGNFALFMFYLGWISDLPSFFSKLLVSYRRINASLMRLQLLLKDDMSRTLVQHHPVYLSGPLPETSTIHRLSTDQLHTLEAINITYHYPMSQRGIEGVNICLKSGTCTVIVGRIGAGKTTLIRVLLGLLPLETGEIRWNNQILKNPSEFLLPPRCAYTAQVPHLFSDTLEGNILLGVADDNNNLQNSIRLAVLEQDVMTLEQGIQTVIGTRGVKLSGGQIQRTAAARMLVRNAELLVFDDMSSALDVETEHKLWERIFGQPSTTYLIVSNSRMILRKADHIIVLKDGKVESEGTLEHLLETCLEMQQLWLDKILSD